VSARDGSADLATLLRDRTLELYGKARNYATERGILLADTKLEWGTTAAGDVLLADEIFTPDSSRFWPADQHTPGRDQPSFDKQFVRDYLSGLDWDKTPPGPTLPDDIVAGTLDRYREAFERLTGTAIDLRDHT